MRRLCRRRLAEMRSDVVRSEFGDVSQTTLRLEKICRTGTAKNVININTLDFRDFKNVYYKFLTILF